MLFFINKLQIGFKNNQRSRI